MAYEQLKLENQICFPLYAASRLIIREYTPLLDELGITYPQYLVLMALWEHDNLTVNEIADKLILNTNTLTPLLKRMEKMELVSRNRLKEDERKVAILLTDKAKKMEAQASEIPLKLLECIPSEAIEQFDVTAIKKELFSIIHALENNDKGLK